MKTEVMTIEDVAEYLRLGRRTVYRLAQSGELPGRKIANRWRFHADEIEAWLRSRAGTIAGPEAEAPGCEDVQQDLSASALRMDQGELSSRGKRR